MTSTNSIATVPDSTPSGTELFAAYYSFISAVHANGQKYIPFSPVDPPTPVELILAALCIFLPPPYILPCFIFLLAYFMAIH